MRMPWQPPRSDKAKSLALVAGWHLLLGAGLVSGLAVGSVRQQEQASMTLDFVAPPIDPRPEPPPPPREKADAAEREEAGAVNLKDKPAAVVLPPPERSLPTRNPLRTADTAATDTGSAASAGSGDKAGPGRGAGGSGDGSGGGGSGGEGSGPGGGVGQSARLLSGNLTGRDYRRIRSFGSPRGQAVLAIDVDAEGRLARCLTLASSGNPALDTELCRLLERTRWEPARDPSGRPVPVALRYVATWERI